MQTAVNCCSATRQDLWRGGLGGDRSERTGTAHVGEMVGSAWPGSSRRTSLRRLRLPENSMDTKSGSLHEQTERERDMRRSRRERKEGKGRAARWCLSTRRGAQGRRRKRARKEDGDGTCWSGGRQGNYCSSQRQRRGWRRRGLEYRRKGRRVKEASGGRASQVHSGSTTMSTVALGYGSVVARSSDDDQSRGVEAAAGSSVVEGTRGCCCLKETEVRRWIERRGRLWCPMEQREERGFEEPKRETTRGGEKETGAWPGGQRRQGAPLP